jgi:hypothetical protein
MYTNHSSKNTGELSKFNIEGFSIILGPIES